MPDFSVLDKYNSAKGLVQVEFGNGSKVLEVELNEFQKILAGKTNLLGGILIADGFVAKNTMTVTTGTLTMPADTVVIGGEVFNIAEPMTIAVLNGDVVYLAMSKVEVNGGSTIYTSGNQSGGSTIPNDIYDPRMGGQETSRRIQAQVKLTKTTGAPNTTYVAICSMISATTFTDNRIKCYVKMNADLVDGYNAGNASGNVPVSNGVINVNLNADLLDNQQGSYYAPIASPAITGIPTAPTAAVNTNTTQLATTAFVLGQVGTAAPLMDGVAAVGSSLLYARQDHVHPSDTVKAPLASPALTGTPTAPTAAANTNTTQLATTAFVLGQVGTATPLMDGVAAVGSSLLYARQDHVHPSDTVKAPLASPALTGTPTAPTAAVSTNTTQLATTAFVLGQVGTATPNMDGVAAVGSSLLYARQDHVHPIDTSRAPLASPTFTGIATLPTNSVSDSLLISLNAAVVAGGTTQGTATALTKDLNVISSGTGGVVVQGATTGKVVVIMNRSGSAINIYPAVGHYFDGLAVNAPILLPNNGFLELYGFSSTQWNTTINAIVNYSMIQGLPTTLAGYGITDAAPAASPALTGTPTAPTAAVSTNTTQVATTAFVLGQAASSAPIMDGVAAVGTSLLYARQDHVHPADTTKAPLASPALTGTPTAPTAAVSTNTTQVATTAFVLGQVGTATPNMNGVAAVGSSLLYSRQDHVHPVDTSRAPLASPTFTGIATLPTNSVSDSLLVSLNAAVAAAGTTQATATALTKDLNVVTTGTGGVVVQGATTGKIVVIMNRSGAAINVYPALGHFFDGLGVNTPISVPNNGFLELYGFSSTQWNTTINAIVNFSMIQGLPTTLAGYGITDAAPSASPALTGTPTAPTAAVSTNTTQVATTAFVLGQVGTATPNMNGVAAVGSSLLYARQDHVHPVDTSRAPLANPTFTGVATLPINSVSDGLLVSLNAAVAAAGTTQGTATALTKDLNVVTSGTGGVVVQGATTGKIVVIMNRTGSAINVYPAAGHYFDGLAINIPISVPANGFLELYGFSSTQWNTTINAIVNWSMIQGKPTTLAGYGITDAAPAASPALTGTPTAPTAAVSTNTTQVATTAFVLGQAASSAPLMDGTAAVGTSLLYARQDHVHASDTTKAPVASPSFTGTVMGNGQYMTTYHGTNMAQFRANWVAANYWGIGATDSGANIQVGATDINGTLLNNGALQFNVDGNIIAKGAWIASNASGGDHGYTISGNPVLAVYPGWTSTMLYLNAYSNGGNPATTYVAGVTSYGNFYVQSGATYTDRVAGVSNNNVVYLGVGNSTVETGAGGVRWHYDPNNYIYQDGGSVTFFFGGSGKHGFYPNGTKSGGSIEVDTVTYGMSPVDSPQVLIEDILWDVEVQEEGTVVTIPTLLAKTIAKYTVVPSVGTAKVTERNSTSFKVTGYTGTLDLIIKGKRIDSQDQYWMMM